MMSKSATLRLLSRSSRRLAADGSSSLFAACHLGRFNNSNNNITLGHQKSSFSDIAKPSAKDGIYELKTCRLKAECVGKLGSFLFTKFTYVVSTLGQDFIAQEIQDLIIAPPTDQQYDKLKTELIKLTALSDKVRLNQLLMTETLGDRKPSQLLRKMRQLLGDRPLEDRILRQLFL